MATITPQYRIQIRDHNLVPIGELTTPLDGDLTLNFNDVGAFVLTVRADSPLASSFAAGNGVIISRDRGDGSGAQTLLSGPIWHLERRLRENVYVLAGPDDLWWLKARRIDPVVGYPYSGVILADSPVRYYRLGEPSGTTATDSSTSAVNGTYNNTPTLGVAAGIDDSNTAVTFAAASSEYVNETVTTALPTGAGAHALECWMKFSANPGATQFVVDLGDRNTATHHLVLALLTTGAPQLSNGTTTVNGTALSTNVWHHLIGTYDGTQLRLYVDGALVGGPTAATMALAYTGNAFTIASQSGATPGAYFNGSLDEVAVYAAALSDVQVALHYAVGKSRYAADAYDTRTGAASTIIRGYVNDNAAAGALSARQVFGLTLAADPAIGSSVTGNARFDNLLTLMQQLALSGGDIGFRVLQTNVGVLTFTLYQPATQSNAIFSRELGNLLDATYTLDGPNANEYLGAGGGQGTARILVENLDSTSISTWGRVEGFQDARDTSDTTTISQRNTAQLAQDAQQTNLSITPTDTAALQYGRDYNLGDIVSVQIDGATITDKIRQLHIQLNSSDQELVTPGIGNAGSGQIAGLFDAKQRALAAVQQQLARLQAAQ